ncbi:BTB/POZ domain-containing protein KCTD6 isoform X5 [Dunckerocampus dactyliophorus]|uniref:BTB/POZ domain-containing protein KCTD6 isoform X5 n=1 Tax=Dunckerocampus dactyliophorus TaxID=161453 RepID=UPI00240676E9|nr:BTB/POZ domain-containing protein KCTD6 isoform X5 [Dunckerocampus dactyliophorus]
MAAELDVVNLFIIAGGTLAIPILAFFASFLLWPSMLIKVYYWYWRRTLGLQVRYTDCGGYRFCYSSRGKPGLRPSILMLHGFSAHKDTWLTVVKYLPKHLHIVCVDMPGHEGTTRTNKEDYSILGQVRRIHQFVETLRLNRKPFHVIGTSMGGNVAGVYAATYSSEICSMTLICPDGIKHPCESKFDNHLQDLERSNFTLNIPLIPTTPEEMEDMFKLCSHVRFKIPQQILQGLVDVRQPHNSFYEEVFMEIVDEKSRYALQEHLHLITAPLQVIWGKQDQVKSSNLNACVEKAGINLCVNLC